MKKLNTMLEDELLTSRPDSLPGGLKSVYCISTMLATSTLAVLRKRRGCMRQIILTTAMAVILLPGAWARAQQVTENDNLFETMMNAQAYDAQVLSALAGSPIQTTLQDTYIVNPDSLTFSYSANSGQSINGTPVSFSSSGTGNSADGTYAWTTEIQFGDLLWDNSYTSTYNLDATSTNQGTRVVQQPGNQCTIFDDTDVTTTTANADGSTDSVTMRTSKEYAGTWKTDKNGKLLITRGEYITTSGPTKVGSDHTPAPAVQGAFLDSPNWWVADVNANTLASGGSGVATMDIIAVPEPSTLAMLGLGTLSLLACLRERRLKAKA